MLRVPMINSLAVGLLALLSMGCQGPRLQIHNAQITAFDPLGRTVSWRADVENSAAGQGFLCHRKIGRAHV